jgi:D-threonate/D-erythronate kinase
VEFYAPAYPLLGRTVRDGCLYVDGIRVDRTVFARDPLEPVTQADIARGFTPQLDVISVPPMRTPRFRSDAVYIFDGETAEHVEHVARLLSARNEWIAAGPTGLAHAIAALQGSPRTVERPRAGRTLVVNGSLHELAQSQINVAIGAGWDVIEPEWDSFEKSGDWMVLKPEPRPAEACTTYARARARSALGVMKRACIDTLVVFGGDTARSIIDELKERYLEAIDELLPGVALARLQWQREGGPKLTELKLISKAGGFGDKDTLLRIRESMR